MTTIKDADKRGYLDSLFRLFHLEDSRGGEIPYHYHEFHKLVLFQAGEVHYIVEGRNYALKEGDLLLIPSYSIHQPVIEKGVRYARMILWIQPELLEQKCLSDGFRICKEQNAYLMKPDRYDRSELTRILHRMEDTINENEYGAEAMSEALFTEAMVLVSKAVMEAEPALREQERPMDNRIEEILQYIDQNLSNDLSVDAVADHFFLSKSWLMHRFKFITNCTMHQYVLQKRLILSIQKMIAGQSAERAAKESGFSDYSTYLRAFRRTYGVSPREYLRYHSAQPKNTEVLME